MAYEDPESILRKLEDSASIYETKYFAQIHEKSMLREYKHSEEYWPAFSKDLDIKIYYLAHYQIWKALQLLEVGNYKVDAQNYLKQGAKALEYLYSNQDLPKEIKIEILFKSMIAYYISGNHACAYVLSKELETFSELPPLLKLIFTILNKNLTNARLIVSEVFSNEEFREYNLLNKNLDVDEIFSKVIYYSTVNATSYYLEYLKSGDKNLFKTALSIIKICVEMSKDLNYVDYWWWLYCLSFVLSECYENSLWEHLKPFEDELITPYLKGYLNQNPPIVELWPSQVKAIPFINDSERRSFCLKMPTSAGKTLIAELTILRFFLDFPDSDLKCIYIAPYRSLAGEIEKTLSDGLQPMGLKVSEIYSDYESNPVENFLIQEANILVVTPEKFDAILRYNPEIQENIGLVIVDEGHLICSDEKNFLTSNQTRNINFEFLLHRLLNKLKYCRFLFISAVLPNVGDISLWISGSYQQLLERDWRPTRLMIGKLIWTGEIADIRYNQINHKPLKPNISIKNFIKTIDLKTISSVRNTTSFPKDSNECLALAALKFAQKGTTLVYAPQKGHVKSFAEVLLKIINLQNKISEELNLESLQLNVDEEQKSLIENCKNIIKSEMGENSRILNYLNYGFVIHHADLPNRVKISIEDLIKKDVVKLIIATTTITHGVNLPIRTVLIKGLYQDHNKVLDHMQFWNICGRAGRAGKENEGRALFLVDESELLIKPKMTPKQIRANVRKHQKKLRIIDEIITESNVSNVISSIYILLSQIIRIWKEKHPTIDLNELYGRLTNNSFDWSEDNKEELIFWINKLDIYLLALSEESENEIRDLSDIEDIISSSLFYIMINQNDDNFVNLESAREILKSRLVFIYTKFPSSNIRKRAYKLGMSLSTCEFIEENVDELYTLFDNGFLWDKFSNQEKINYLLDISSFVLKMNDVFEDFNVPDEWEIILKFWLEGKNVSKIAAVDDVYTKDLGELKLFIEKFCGYRLPWGINSLLNFMKMYYSEISEDMPLITLYISNMIKYGIIDPKAICIMPYMNQNRDISLILSKICPYGYKNPEEIIDWLKKLTFENLIIVGINDHDANMIIKMIDKNTGKQEIHKKTAWSFELDNERLKYLNNGDRIFLTADLPLSEYKLFTLNGDFIASLIIEDEDPEWIFDSNIVDYVISDIEEIDENLSRISLTIEV